MFLRNASVTAERRALLCRAGLGLPVAEQCSALRPPSLTRCFFCIYLHSPLAIQPLHDKGYTATAQNQMYEDSASMSPRNPLLKSIAMNNRIHNSPRFISAGLCLLFFLLANHAGATVIYWDNNGTGTASSGTWDTTTKNWAASSVLTASTVVWNTADAACFTAGAASPGIITITRSEEHTSE